jgi:hypothetical protein
MNDELRNILEQNAKEYYKNGVEAEKKEEYNSAVTLFFKAIASLSDLFILVKEDKMPSNHNERFRILELKYPEIYRINDKDFPFYQDSYRSRLTGEVSEMLKNDAKRIFELLNIRI